VIGDLCYSDKDREARALDNLKLHHFDITMAYRYQQSSRHFVGTVEQVQREIRHNQVENDYHLFDLSINYELNPRWSLTASLPVLDAKRNEPNSAIFRTVGIGDAAIGARLWVFRPPTESGGNVSFGFSLKMPTGADSAKGTRNNGQVVVVDQSIQPGDGSWGIALESQGFRQTYFHTMLYYSGSYLFNLRGETDVPTFRSKQGEQFMSAADQYLYRAGLSHRVFNVKWLFASIGGRMEGVPVRNAFSSSEGFRRPGYAIDVDPGFLVSMGKNIISCNVPFAVERNRKRSVADIEHGGHGDAAFADYALLLSYSRHF
jgi:hypothetical protein